MFRRGKQIDGNQEREKEGGGEYKEQQDKERARARAPRFAFKLRPVQSKFSIAPVPHAINAARGIIIFCI